MAQAHDLAAYLARTKFRLEASHEKFTRQRERIAHELFCHGPITSFEIAKKLGVNHSVVYRSLAAFRQHRLIFDTGRGVFPRFNDSDLTCLVSNPGQLRMIEVELPDRYERIIRSAIGSVGLSVGQIHVDARVIN